MANPAPGPGLKDWALLAGSTLFVVVGIAILPIARDVGIVNIAFFGCCAAVALITIRRKRRDRDYRDRGGALTVQVAGGVPIRASRAQALWLGGVLAGLGIVIIVFGGEMGVILQVIGGVIALVGVVLLVGVAAGWLAVGSITFEPHGLTFAGRKLSFRVPWDNIAAIGSGEVGSNPALVLQLHDRGGVAVEPAGSEPLLRRSFASNERWVGAPIVIMPSHYAIDLPVLERAIARYVFDPAARSELARRQPS